MTVPPPELHIVLSEEQADRLAEIEEALQRMEQLDERGSAVVECRFYGGMTVEETAAALGISSRTVKRDWQMAQAWLYREVKLRM
jgi:RNA polymerase sigma factor (sigma-70 family)